VVFSAFLGGSLVVFSAFLGKSVVLGFVSSFGLAGDGSLGTSITSSAFSGTVFLATSSSAISKESSFPDGGLAVSPLAGKASAAFALTRSVSVSFATGALSFSALSTSESRMGSFVEAIGTALADAGMSVVAVADASTSIGWPASSRARLSKASPHWRTLSPASVRSVR
jgi:hypothetical protein